MTSQPTSRFRLSFDSRPPHSQWAMLLLVSAIPAIILEVLRVPAALLLGFMAGGILLGAGGATVRVPRRAFIVAQGIIGCLIARGIPASTLGEMWKAWPVCAATVAAIIAASTLLGWLLARWRVLPGTTAIW